MVRRLVLGAFGAGLLAVVLGSCTSETRPEPDAGSHHQAPGEICTDIAWACHYLDRGYGEINRCHELGHDGPDAQCAEEYDYCMALCSAEEPDGGEGGDGGLDGGHGGSGGGNPEDGGLSGLEKCRTLSNVCHGLSPDGPLEECHELGHAGNIPICEENWERCFDLCTKAAGQ